MKQRFEKVDFSDKLFKNIIALRREVFCGEEGEKASFIKDSRDEKGFHVVCAIGDELLGCGSLYDNGDGEFEISKIAVSKDYRNFGIGSSILKELRKIAKEHGAKSIVGESLAECVGFFTKNGIPYENIAFEKEGRRYIKYNLNLVFEGAEWLEFQNTEAVIARCDFVLDKKIPADLFVTGLGYCNVYVNGKSITDKVLYPAWTNFDFMDTANMEYPIFDKMTRRIVYEKIDVSKFLKKGENTIVFHIGGGWYAQHECPNEGVKCYGDGNLKLCFKLLSGKAIIAKSDSAVKYTKSYVKRASVYYGEDQDSRIGFYDFSDISYSTDGWKTPEIIPAPVSVLNEADFTPDRIIRKLKPKCIFRKGDYAIYDIGENIAGYPVVEFIEDAYTGESCVMRFAENLNKEGGLDFHSAGGEFRMQKDTYIYDNKCKAFHPQFTWHGARYFDVLGRVEVKEYRVVHTDLKPIVKFKSSNETLQWIFDAYIRTQNSNVHGCVPSDCPHRERLGYTGDGQLTVNAVMTCFDAESMYRKWIRDVADCQDIFNGHVQHTAPFYGGGGGPGGWGGAMVIVPYAFYKHYGDKTLIEKYYPNMLRYLDYLESHSEKGLVVREEKGGWCLGDWCSPKNKNLIPEPFVNTYFHLKTLKMTMELAEALGKPQKELKARYETVKKAFLEKYYDKKTATFCGSVEACDAYGYDLGLGNEKTLKAIVEKYEKLGQFDTGIFGTDILIRTLCENGHKDLAFKLLTSEKENSFFNMKKQGATTLWENWDGCDSHSHPMFGAVVEYIVKYFNEI
ncbi:MAG: GNAT family N-acetyltransferase [Ruminococcaceae bacterium]|nr:GNAT family N-acetyltransferase [Oscillospiraceae bacterium]